MLFAAKVIVVGGGGGGDERLPEFLPRMENGPAEGTQKGNHWKQWQTTE